MLKTKVLSPDDVDNAELADAFLTQKKDSLSVLVAANLRAAIYKLLCNVTAVKARRTWVLQRNTLCGINYEAALRVADVECRYIGMSATSFADHNQLALNRWGRHYYELSNGIHCNPGFQQAFGSASLPSPAHGRTPSSPPHSRVVAGRGGPDGVCGCHTAGRTRPPSLPGACDWQAVPDSTCRIGDPATGDLTEQRHPGGRRGLSRAEFFACFEVRKTFDRGAQETYIDFVGRVSEGENARIQECARDCRASAGREMCLNIVGNHGPSRGSQGSHPGAGGEFRCLNCKLPANLPSPLCLRHEAPGTTKLQRCVDCGEESRSGTCPSGASHTSLQFWQSTRPTCATCHSGTRKVPYAVLTTRALQRTNVSTADKTSPSPTRCAAPRGANTTKAPIPLRCGPVASAATIFALSPCGCSAQITRRP